MDNETHRAHTVAGLHQLADFLFNYDMSAELNPASPVEVTYCVLEDDTDAARAEFEARAAFLYEYGGMHRFTQRSRPHNDTTQHVASLAFGNGCALYRVLWIERTQADV